MTLVERAISRPVTTIMLFLSAVVLGLAAGRLLPLEALPEIDVPFVSIEVPYPGSTPSEVERQITRPVEAAIATLGGIKKIESRSRADSASVFVQFDWGKDVSVAAIEARERVEAIRDELPADVQRILVFKFNTSDAPIMALRISSDSDLSQAYDLLQRHLVRPVERLPGVARVDLQGVEPYEVWIEVEPERLTVHGLTVGELMLQLQAANFSLAGGDLSADGKRYRVTPLSEWRSIEQIENQIIDQRTGLRLHEVATVKRQTGERDYARHLHRNYSVGISVFRERGANLVDVGERVLATVEAISEREEMQGIEIFILENQADGVKSSLSELLRSGLIGAVLSFLILFAFLRSLQTTLMVTLAVPISITVTLGALYFLNVSLNILSMMGLLLAIGMLVDNAVVVAESIFAERQKNPGNARAAAVRGVSAVALAVTAGTFTSMIVFLPNIFGEQNQISVFMSHVGYAICVSLLVSLVIARTIIPLLAARSKAEIKPDAAWLRVLRRGYERALNWTLTHRGLTVLGLLGLLVVTIAVPMQLVNSDMFPEDANRSLFLRYNLNARYTLDEIKPAVDTIENYLYDNAEALEIEAVYSYYAEDGNAQSTILLRDDDNVTRAPADVRDEIAENLPTIAIGKPSFDRNRSGAGEQLRVSVLGQSSERLVPIARDVARLLSGVEGLTDVRSEADAGEAELQIAINRDAADQYGFSSREIAQAIQLATRELPLRDLITTSGELPVKLKLDDRFRRSADALGGISLRNNAGEEVPLSAMVTLQRDRGPTTIRRENRRTSLGITLALDDSTTDEARDEVEALLSNYRFPEGYGWSFGAGFSEEDEAGQKMAINMLLAIVFIYLVLAAMFESMVYPLTIMTSIVFAVLGVYWFFWLTGTTMSLMAMIGMLILIGVVVNNGIVLIDHVNQLRLAGVPRRQAVAQAGSERLRPILMTVATTVLGLLPLSFGNTQIGGDGPSYYPMARAIVGGLIFSTAVTLLIAPTIYLLLDDLRRWSRRIAARPAFGRRRPAGNTL